MLSSESGAPKGVRTLFVDFLHDCGDGMGRLSWSMRFIVGDKRMERAVTYNQKLKNSGKVKINKQRPDPFWLGPIKRF
ncbi:hypothetical protein OH491_07320 [Termitidicoccus mucosus]|uniref:hypothetical protein n=1 Tax=Termitidicoccus mucosus TaxID=1184151 RepID=UPI0031832015